MKLPVAEIFVSPQGEGTYSGQLMTFIRLAGCTVGRKPTKTTPEVLKQLYVLNPKHTVCVSCFGQQFLCDTDYSSQLSLGEKQLLDVCSLAHTCITGGEPFMHSQDIWDKLSMLPFRPTLSRTRMLHIETSGTLPIAPKIAKAVEAATALREDWRQRVWITCSPKIGFRAENAELVSEWKFVIDFSDAVNINELHDSIEHFRSMGRRGVPVYIQPVNSISSLSKEGYAAGLSFIRNFPDYRISVQIHKILGVS